MKKYIIVFSLSLLTLTVSAQKKKKKQGPPPVVKPIPEPPKVIEQAGTSESMPVMISMPMRATDQVRIKKTDGQELNLEKLEELVSTDLAQVKTLFLGSSISGKKLSSEILQKIMDEGNQMESLEISNLGIDTFPEIKTIHPKLKKITLSRNNLSVLPASISNLTALEEFDCNNPLTSLPASFAQLKNLKQLGLNGNLFRTFPKEIFSLNKLSFLYLSGNYKGETKLTDLPDQFDRLPELKELGVEHAGLSTLPKSIAALKNLEKANFSFNQFTSFPAALYNNPKLVFVPFTNNPLQWEPFLASVKKIKWSGLFFLNDTGLSKKQYEQVQQILSKTDVYYDEMND
ncbi:leucine-rich repeat domain-containing protein [Sphingobacterium sp. UBA5670]|uniref:leucine-rich repeat domain-containing protein n=1 Tax=Sphingobacterium sp. UBA5670 TaxID=1947502 RepID=UPI0025FC7714|nr:leucine-rich repeat domain-containing protein [Sphingobacterium sp. UBA5670]